MPIYWGLRFRHEKRKARPEIIRERLFGSPVIHNHSKAVYTNQFISIFTFIV